MHTPSEDLSRDSSDQKEEDDVQVYVPWKEHCDHDQVEELPTSLVPVIIGFARV
tara:strand:- start:780 stop:941 length:162 start_codon:yes stop_codon:yes gene_type:complete